MKHKTSIVFCKYFSRTADDDAAMCGSNYKSDINLYDFPLQNVAYLKASQNNVEGGDYAMQEGRTVERSAGKISQQETNWSLMTYTGGKQFTLQDIY